MKRFPPKTLAEFEATKYLRIRSGEHRYIAIWVVVVEGRVIVRSWNDNPKGWYRAFRADPRGSVMLGQREVPIRAVPLRSTKINDLTDSAYGLKYTTAANRKYVENFATPARKAATLELLPQ